MSLVAVAAVLSTLHFEGDVTPGGGDYVDVPFTVPGGTVEIEIAKSYTTGANILDFGVFAPEGFRGWSGGLLDNIVVGVAQSSRGYLPGAIASGTGWTVAIGKAQLSALGTHWTVDITFRDNATLPVLPKATYSPVVLSSDRRWYKGDFHVHSSQSGDSRAEMQSDIDLAHMRGLDFLNLSDHNTISQHALVAAQQASWPVLVLRSSEITTYSGHGNGVGIHDYVDHRLGHNGRTMSNVIDDVVAQGGAFIINHAANNLGTACIGCGWAHAADIPWEKVSAMEVLTAGYDVGVQAFTPQILQMWDQQEDAGHRISAVTGSDDHSAGMNESATGAPIGSPCSLVLADELSEAGIVAGIQHQHTMANLRGPDDPPVEVIAHGKKGEQLTIGDDVDNLTGLEVHVTGASGYFLQLWRDGQNIAQIPVKSDDFTHTFEDKPSSADHRYRVHLIDDTNRPVVITSYVYAHGVTATGGGGCSSGGGGASALPLIGLALLAARRRRLTKNRS
jgi:MYXO-CTERM domain-containing protein